jgi:hypothetical protein
MIGTSPDEHRGRSGTWICAFPGAVAAESQHPEETPDDDQPVPPDQPPEPPRELPPQGPDPIPGQPEPPPVQDPRPDQPRRLHPLVGSTVVVR